MRATLEANNNHVAITAPIVTGYNFVCWAGVTSTGWVGWSNIEHYDRASTNIWTVTVDRQVALDAWALYAKA